MPHFHNTSGRMLTWQYPGVREVNAAPPDSVFEIEGDFNPFAPEEAAPVGAPPPAPTVEPTAPEPAPTPESTPAHEPEPEPAHDFTHPDPDPTP